MLVASALVSDDPVGHVGLAQIARPQLLVLGAGDDRLDAIGVFFDQRFRVGHAEVARAVELGHHVGRQVDRPVFGLGAAGGHVENDVFKLAGQYLLSRVVHVAVVPVAEKLHPLIDLEEDAHEGKRGMLADQF
ncbi:hypothetical protein D3C84_682750 [compost metagenome]